MPSARARTDTEWREKIRSYHQASRGIYGSPRIHAGLVAEGIRVGRKRVARLMRAAGLQGVSRRKGPRTTVRDVRSRPASDLVIPLSGSAFIQQTIRRLDSSACDVGHGSPFRDRYHRNFVTYFTKIRVPFPETVRLTKVNPAITHVIASHSRE